MRNVIIVREYKETDKFQCKELLQSSIMSHVSSAFFTFLLKEAILQIMVLLAAVCFIFLGLPIHSCICVVPFVAISVYVITYTTHFFKASQISESQPLRRWVAEAFEPYLLNSQPQDVKYGVFNDFEYKSEDIDTSSYTSKIVGVISLKDFYGPDNKLWLYGFAVHPKYQRKHVGTLLLRRLVDNTPSDVYDSIEAVTTDLQCEARLLLQKEGFQMSQIYHSYSVGLIPLGKYQLSLRLPCK